MNVAAAVRQIPFARVDCSGSELQQVAEVLRSGWLTTGAKARELETRFAAALGVRHALAVNSCTSALHLALEAIGIGPGDKVLVPTMTFTATAEVVRYLDAVPVLLDVDPATASVTPAIVREAIAAHPDARALIVVHYGGQPAAMTDRLAPDGTSVEAGIVSLCRAHGLHIVEDAAHAFPARIGDMPVGNFGDATCFSFYANKTITTGEGGMVVTNDDALAERMGVMRLHGIDRPIWERYTDRRNAWEYDVVAPGFKYNMPDLNAAVGLAQLERADAMRRARERCAAWYTEAFEGTAGLRLLERRCRSEEHAWHLFPVLLQAEAPLSRDRLIRALAALGIGSSVHYKPIHRLRYYRETFGFRSADYPGAERLWSSSISLPIYSLLSDDELDQVVSAVLQLLGGID